jgi:hypothetical protein
MPRCSGMNREIGVYWPFPPEPRGVVAVHQKQYLSRRLFRPSMKALIKSSGLPGFNSSFCRLRRPFIRRGSPLAKRMGLDG